MQSIKVKYTNFFGEETEEKLHFHLSKAELMNMELQRTPLSAKIALINGGEASPMDAYKLLQEFVGAASSRMSVRPRRSLRPPHSTPFWTSSATIPSSRTGSSLASSRMTSWVRPRS